MGVTLSGSKRWEVAHDFGNKVRKTAWQLIPHVHELRGCRSQRQARGRAPADQAGQERA